MTIEEQAIVYFKDMRKRMCEDHLKVCPKDSVAYHATLIEKGFYDAAIKALEQKPCEDAISRREAISIAGIATLSVNQVVTALKKLPSVNPQKPICPSEGVDPAYEKTLNKWIGAEVLDRIRNEMHATAEKHEDGVYYLRDEWVDEIIDKYAEGSDKE